MTVFGKMKKVHVLGCKTIFTALVLNQILSNRINKLKENIETCILEQQF